MTQRKYAWREGMPKPPIDADTFGQIKDEIEARLGTVRAEDIVEAARDPTSPLHVALCWDDVRAADGFRIIQARHLLGGLQVVRVEVTEGPSLSNKAMFRVKPRDGRAGYMSADKIISDRDLRKQIIGSARRELEAFLAKYSGVLAMSAHVPKLREVIDGMLDEVEQLETDANRRRARPTEGKPVHTEQQRAV